MPARLPLVTVTMVVRAKSLVRPILAGALSPNQSSGLVRRGIAGLGVLAVVLALTTVASSFTMLLLGLSAVFLTAWALFADDRRALIRFAAINGVAMLLLAWAVTERSEVVVERRADEIDVSVNGVRLAASLAGIETNLDRVAVELSPVDERPVSAPWMFANLPWLEGFGDWLEGGMRGGVERLRVTDVNGADLVPPVLGLWQPDRATDTPRVAAGGGAWEVVRSDDETVALVSPQLSTDRFQVTATTARPSGAITLTLAGEEPGTSVLVTVAPDRRVFEIVAKPIEGDPETLVGGPFVYRRTVVGWTQALLREIGRAWLVALGLVALSRVLAVSARLELPHVTGFASRAIVGLVAILLGLVGLTLTGLVSLVLLDGIPHTVESIAYVFQAEVFRLGGMWVPAPVLPEFFTQAYIAATPDGRWFGVLPPGQSLLLAAGMAAGVPWIVSPLMTGLAIAMTVVLGRATYGTLAGVVAGLLLLFSPFVLMLSGDMLAHPTGLLLAVLMSIGLVMSRERYGTFGWLLAGAAMGGLVLTRPLAAVGIGIPLTVMLVLGGRGTSVGMLAARALIFALAATPGVFYAGYFNAALTGSPSLPPLSLWSDVDRIGFGADVGTRGGHDLTTALGNTWANVVVLVRHLYGWPSYLTLALAMVPFVLGSWSRWDRLLVVSIGGLIVAHWLYWSDGIIYGPRFTFEATAALALLTARGAALLARGDGTTCDESYAVEAQESDRKIAVAQPTTTAALLRATGARGIPATLPDGSVPTAADRAEVSAGSTGTPSVLLPAVVLPVQTYVTPRRPMSGAPFVIALVVALFAVNTVGYLPDVVLAYRDYNGVSRAGLEVVQDAGLERAVIFVQSDWPDWQSYGSVFLENGPFLDRPVIFARDLGEAENWRLMTRYAESRGLILRDLQLTEVRP